jgi:response regulator of citrate/malate metabolism
VVEDDQRIARLHATLVGRTAGLQLVGVAETEAQALRLLRERRPALVVCDLGLRRGSGVAFLHELTGQPAPPAVIVVTADRSRETEHVLDAMGIRELLHKPFDLSRLQSALSRFAREAAHAQTG